MSLKEIFTAVSAFFKRNKMDFGIVGAFALCSYGYVRATRDIDFITRIENREKTIKKYFIKYGQESYFDEIAGEISED